MVLGQTPYTADREVKDSVQDVEIRPRTDTMANTEGEGDRAAQPTP